MWKDLKHQLFVKRSSNKQLFMDRSSNKQLFMDRSSNKQLFVKRSANQTTICGKIFKQSRFVDRSSNQTTICGRILKKQLIVGRSLSNKYFWTDLPKTNYSICGKINKRKQLFVERSTNINNYLWKDQQT